MFNNLCRYLNSFEHSRYTVCFARCMTVFLLGEGSLKVPVFRGEFNSPLQESGHFLWGDAIRPYCLWVLCYVIFYSE